MRREWFYCPACRRAFPSEVPDDCVAGQVIEEIGEGRRRDTIAERRPSWESQGVASSASAQGRG